MIDFKIQRKGGKEGVLELGRLEEESKHVKIHYLKVSTKKSKNNGTYLMNRSGDVHSKNKNKQNVQEVF